MTRSGFRSIFVGSNGIRAGWRCLIFVLLVISMGGGFSVLRRYVLDISSQDAQAVLEPKQGAVSEAIAFLIVALAALIMSRIERRPWARYGLPLRGRRHLFFGLVWGFATLSVVMGTLWMIGT